MNKIRLLLSLLFISLYISASEPERKKVAVVLSGGGAKGVAHVGALRVIEEAGIPIDLIVGTSMGSIIGGLYSIGYSPAQLDSMILCQDWAFQLSDKVSRNDRSFAEKERSEKYLITMPFMKKPKDALGAGMVKGQNISSLFSELTQGYHDSINFDSLPIPFACVAENIVDGKEVVFRNGVLSQAMRASMSIPGAFEPVKLNGMVLVDGGMKNNYPVSVAKAMGADIVIGVDVQNDLRKADDLHTLKDVLGQIISLSCIETLQKGIEQTDVYIKVNVKGYSSSSFFRPALDTLMIRGERAARHNWDSLVNLKTKIGVAPSYMPKPHGPYVAVNRDTFKVKDIIFVGSDYKDEALILKRCKLTKNSIVTKEQIKKAIAVFYGTMHYSGVTYKLTNEGDGYNLYFMLEEKHVNSMSAGLRFDSEEFVAIIGNILFNLNTTIPSSVSTTARIGNKSSLELNYQLEPWMMQYFNFIYEFENNDLYIYKDGHRSYNLTYQRHFGEISFSDIWLHKMKFTAGAHYEYYNYDNLLIPVDDNFHVNLASRGYLSFFGRLLYDTFDQYSYPRKGTKAKLQYCIYGNRDGGVSFGKPFQSAEIGWEKVISVSNRFQILPAVYGRTLWEPSGIPYPYLNAVGGMQAGRYTDQQLPFVGISYMEIADYNVLIAKLALRQRFGANNYLTLTGNAALNNNDFVDMVRFVDTKAWYGGGLTYGYNSIFGPLELTVNYSNATKKVGVYASAGFFF